MKTFQVVLLIVFGLLAGLAVAFFSGAIKLPTKASNSPTGGATGAVVMWGTFPRSAVRETIEVFNKSLGGGLSLSYVEKDPTMYQKELLDSFAFGGTPDIFLLSNDLVYLYGDKIVTIPYEGFSDRMFNDSYITASEVFKTEAGILGFPFVADPLVMYYNKDHFDAKGVAQPPAYWKDLTTLVPTFTEKNELLEIKKSGLAFGESTNVRHFKEILLAMNFQLGNQVVFRNYQKAAYESTLSNKSYISSKPAEDTLKYFLEFSNPLKTAYSWNKSMPDSLVAFVGGDVSTYFGFASEATLIEKMNPNLNFDMVDIPQVAESGTQITYANIYALSVPKTTKNFQGAYYIASQLANGPFAQAFALVGGYAPVRRDLIATSKGITKFTDVYYTSALKSRSWADPGRTETNAVFSRMVEDVLSGLKTYPKSVSDANTELKLLLSKQ